MTHSISEDANVGHEVKSRAESNMIEDNQILDGLTGTASYSIDLPNGGNDVIQGNTIEKGPDASAPIVIHIGGPMLPYAESSVLIQGNTIINDYGPAAQIVNDEFTTPVTVSDNTVEKLQHDFERHRHPERKRERSGGNHSCVDQQYAIRPTLVHD